MSLLPEVGDNILTSLNWGKRIGGGAFSVVYAVESAVAKIYTNRKVTALLEKEMLSRLSGSGIAPRQLHFFASRNNPYIIMEHVGDVSLDNLDLSNVSKEDIIQNFVIELLGIVVCFHKKYEISHLDLKTDNVVLSSEGKMTLIDFNLSTTAKHKKGMTGNALFSAPEVVGHIPSISAFHNIVKGKYECIISHKCPKYLCQAASALYSTQHADLWSVGAIGLYLVTCKTPASNAKTISDVHRSHLEYFQSQKDSTLIETLLSPLPEDRVCKVPDISDSDRESQAKFRKDRLEFLKDSKPSTTNETIFRFFRGMAQTRIDNEQIYDYLKV